MTARTAWAWLSVAVVVLGPGALLAAYVIGALR